MVAPEMSSSAHAPVLPNPNTSGVGRRILIITPSLPYPPNWGFGIRVYNLIKHLSERHRVTLLTYGAPDQGYKVTALQEYCEAVHTVPPALPDRRAKRLAQLRSLCSTASFQTLGLRSPAMQARLTELLTAQRFDVVQAESSQMAAFDFGSVPVIVDEHNIEYELLQRMYQSERSPLRRLYNWLEYVKFRREEVACWRRMDAGIFTSAREDAIFRQTVAGKPSLVAPNGVDIDRFQPSPEPVDPDSVVFTGLISYRPNTDGVLYFAREILPRIIARRPTARFTIVGMGPTEEVRRLAGEHVVVTDEVPDVRPYLARAAVVVVPLRMGSGTRLKVLEAMAMGKPTVSTSVGCEGIELRSGEHLLIEDDPDAFARAVVQLMEDRALAQRLGSAGRVLAEARYSWRSVVDVVEAFHSSVLTHAR